MTPPPPTGNRFEGLSVTVMGLGLFGGGVGATRYLARQGAEVTVTDLRPAKALESSIAALADLDVRFVLGLHEESDFRSADMVVVNPSVPPSSPYLDVARNSGVPLETEIHLFLEACRAPILGVTGSNGKTTTTSLLAAMQKAAGRTTWLGGNIGGSLLEQLPRIEPEHRVVLELSSFQLEALERHRPRLSVSVVTNLTPNHLDHHGTLEAYQTAKQQIVLHQSSEDVAILNRNDPQVAKWASATKARVRWFGFEADDRPGVHLLGDEVYSSGDDGEFLFSVDELPLIGRFNVANALAASAAALADGVPAEAIRRAIVSFRPVEHRLEPVATIDGALWYNDSVSTTPESTLAALEALPAPIIWIAGGHDKGLDLEPLVRTAAHRIAAAVLVGPMGERLESLFQRTVDSNPSSRTPIVRVGQLREAVRKARALSRPGATVLLSPATSSYDEFPHFAERGRVFKALLEEERKRSTG